MTDSRSAATDRPVDVETGTEIDRYVAEDAVVLLELYTRGCSKCDAMEPVLGNVARATDATVLTCNPRDDPGLVTEYDVRSVPKLLLYVDGERVATLADGFVPADRVVDFVESRGQSNA
jgi:thioredoxin 1